MKKITIISLLSALLCFNTSCDDYLDVNNNVDAPDYVDDYLYLSGVQQTLSDIYQDARVYAPMVRMLSQTATTYASHYNPRGSDTGALIWRTVYFNHGMNMQNLITEAEAQQHWHMAGIAYVLKAFGWDMLTKIYGEAPLKQFLRQDLNRFDYDYQPDIYAAVQEWALKGIEYLKMEDTTAYGAKISGNDWIYGGDISKWIKFGYSLLVRNLASLSNKEDFTSKYADKLLEYSQQAFASAADDALMKVAGGSSSAPYSAYNNLYGTYNVYLGTGYVQNDYAVQLMTGTVPRYQEDGDRVDREIPEAPAADATPEEWSKYYRDSLFYEYFPYELRDDQVVASVSNDWMWQPGATFTKAADGKTLIITPPANDQKGYYDPRVIAKLATLDDPTYLNTGDAYQVRRDRFVGATSPAGVSTPNGSIMPTIYGRDRAATGGIKDETQAEPNDGKGRWIYHDEAPYVLMTYAEIQFCVAEAQWKKNNKAAAYTAFKNGIKGDMDFTKGQLRVGLAGKATGGDKINAATFQTLADQYMAGPFVEGLGAENLTLSHIMMQKWVSLFVWGVFEAWVDMRKYHYDIQYTGTHPSLNNGWDAERWITTKSDDDPNKVYKGYYLAATRNIEFCGAPFNVYNEGSPMYRVRPRYNSEYMWNLEKLEVLKPIAGTAENYHCSIPWFAYPNEAEYQSLTGYTPPTATTE